MTESAASATLENEAAARISRLSRSERRARRTWPSRSSSHQGPIPKATVLYVQVPRPLEHLSHWVDLSTSTRRSASGEGLLDDVAEAGPRDAQSRFRYRE